jgi:hypothetical protein
MAGLGFVVHALRISNIFQKDKEAAMRGCPGQARHDGRESERLLTDGPLARETSLPRLPPQTE